MILWRKVQHATGTRQALRQTSENGPSQPQSAQMTEANVFMVL